MACSREMALMFDQVMRDQTEIHPPVINVSSQVPVDDGRFASSKMSVVWVPLSIDAQPQKLVINK